MAATRPMDMPDRMAVALVTGRTAIRVMAVHVQSMFVDMVTMHMV